MKKARVIALAAACSFAAAAHAQSAGDIVLNAGWFHLAPQVSSQPISITALGATSTVSGSGAMLDSADTIGLTATYFVTDHIAAEAVLGIPPRFTLSGSGTLSSLGQMGTAYEWSPTVLLKYYFNDAQSRFRPYVGAGGSYVWYSGVKLSSAVASGAFLYSSTYGTALEGTTTAKLSSSFAPVVNAGFAYNFDKHWSAGLSISYMWLSTRATLTTHSSVGTVTSSAKIHVNPIVTFASVGYRF
ncbi:OmpW family outer membrane protein [Trinickia caryophylli]|uniref:Outer membrane protein n=1 Tax=Trinickia caryophylli TaxID=28094 RepID=A0A1X7FLF8_TRICW|nr:OmpW family outer membrane protein [Trinickia caryophylli]PMS13160.1 OmpW family protein [Trinickia caryophylli]TRX19314.1 OmpW family protein [Trinickia caryophylli]WQE13384.1 OmpW family outer membrane protein [Trinickia caryophylli]SMF53647.1 outer membrane protein [Trinickia caryophylli]GLU34097.1 outer membrane protein [Trinickia caryophylli]